MPTVVELSHKIGVGGCGWLISCKASHMGLALQASRNKAPNSASAANAATSLRMVHKVCTASLRKMSLPWWILLPRKKWPPAVL
eukprot:8938703-Ditylum_brightwellii.AAC.1